MENDRWERVQFGGDKSLARIDNENLRRDKYERDNDEGKPSNAIQFG